MQWKPICYTSTDRTLSASQQMSYYSPPDRIIGDDHTIMESSVAFPWFNHSSSSHVEVRPMNVSFGQPKDGFYRASNFTEW